MKVVRLRKDDILEKGDVAENRKHKLRMVIGNLAGRPVSDLPENMRVFRLWPHGDERKFYRESYG